MCLQNTQFLEKTSQFILYFVSLYLTSCFVSCSVDAGPEVILHAWISIIYICLDLFGFVCFAAGAMDAPNFWELNPLPSCRYPITLHIVFSMSSNLTSGILSSAGPSPGTTKNLHLMILSLCLNLTLHTPNCSVPDCLYDFSMMELFLWQWGCYCWFRK